MGNMKSMTNEKFSIVNDVSEPAIQFLSNMLRRSGLKLDDLKKDGVYVFGSTAVKMFRIQHPELKQFVSQPSTFDLLFTNAVSYEELIDSLKQNGYSKSMYAQMRWYFQAEKCSYYKSGMPMINLVLFDGNMVSDVLALCDLSITKCAYHPMTNFFTVGNKVLINMVYAPDSYININSIFRCN